MSLSEVRENKDAVITAIQGDTRFMSRITSINDGQIVESGDHTQLMEHGGMYAHMVALQG